MLKYLIGIILITVLSLCSLAYFLINLDPELLKTQEWVIFYINVFLSLSGILTLTEVLFRRIKSGLKVGWKMFKRAFRRGIILAILLTLILYFHSARIFDWSLSLLLLGSGILFEFLMGYREKKKDLCEKN